MSLSLSLSLSLSCFFAWPLNKPLGFDGGGGPNNPFGFEGMFGFAGFEIIFFRDCGEGGVSGGVSGSSSSGGGVNGRAVFDAVDVDGGRVGRGGNSVDCVADTGRSHVVAPDT